MGKVFDIFLEENLDKKMPVSYKINEDFLDQLKYLSENVYTNASVSQLIDVAIEYMAKNQTVVPYSVDKAEHPAKHNFSLSKSSINSVKALKKKYPMFGFSNLVNIAIHDALEFESDHLKNFNQNQFEE